MDNIKDKNITFSIILATCNRDKFIEDCINSILNQTYQNFEIIVVDQSDDLKTKEIIYKIKSKLKDENKIIYIKNEIKGLSLARNTGIINSQGDYICLMDDDAEYSKDFLEKSYRYIKKDKIDVCCGVIKDKYTDEYFLQQMKLALNTHISKNNFMELVCSASLVISKQLLDRIGRFDELFGVGAKFGSAEESDVIFRLLNIGAKINFYNDLLVYHPYPKVDETQLNLIKTYNYGIGFGAFCKKNMKLDKIYFTKLMMISLIRPFIGIFANLFRSRYKSKESLQRFKGRIVGYWMYK